MKLRRRLAAAAAGIVAAPLVVLVLPSAPALAHGWITSPPSRQEMCARGRVTGCGGVQYEPQSVEAPKGSRLCSGGSGFRALDDESKNWPATSVGSTVTFQWRLTAAHRTTTWHYYVDGALFKTFDQGNTQPPANISHTLSGLPGGRHKVLAVWNIGDTPNAFYNCVDLQVGGGTQPTTPAPDPTTPAPGACTAPAWTAATAYSGGQTVTHAGHTWRAKWWTRGETPGSTGQWGVWSDLGPCGAAAPHIGHAEHHQHG